MKTIYLLVAVTLNNPKPVGTYFSLDDCKSSAKRVYIKEPYAYNLYCIPVKGYFIPKDNNK